MSVIFSGLERLDQGLENQLNWFYFDVTDVTTVNGERNLSKLLIDADHEILLDQCFELQNETDTSNEVITSSEKFLLNGQKMMVLENVVFFVPRLFFCFRPAYSCQLSIRYIVRLLTGITEPSGIGFVIRNNYKDLTRYFGDVKIISEFIHTGKMLITPSQYNTELIKQILMGLVEYLSMQISDEFFNVAVSHLIQFGDNTSILSNDQQIRTCNETYYKELKNAELCMFAADFCCVICGQYFSKNTELRAHIKQHSQLACLDCEITFENYEYLLVHKLTFCHSPCLLKICLYCNNEAKECTCAKMHRALQKSIKIWMESERENGALQLGLFSLIFQYGIQEWDVYSLTKLPEEEEQMGDWSQSEIDAMVVSILPSIIAEEDSVRLDNVRISFHKIKEVLVEYFNSFEEFESYVLNFTIPIKDICGEKSCTENFTRLHIQENHPICAFAKNLRSDEVPVRYNTKRELYLHLLGHKILVRLPMRCKICNFRFKTLNSHILLSEIFNHAKNHNKLEKLHCVFNTELACQVARPQGSIEELLHNFMFHADQTEILQIFQNLLTCDEVCNKSPGKDIKTTRDNGSKQVVNANIQGSYGPNDADFRSGVNKQDGIGLLGVNHTENFACKNEDHSSHIHFSDELSLRKHIFEFHKCPICNFSTMYNKDLLAHFKTHTEKNQEKCDICNTFVKKVKEHRIRVHAKCPACKRFFIDLQQLKKHEPNCSQLNETEFQGKEAVLQKDMASLKIDSSLLESNFSQILIKMLQNSDCNEEEKLLGASVIQKFASESTIAKNRARLENVSIRKSDASFFDIPNFRHSEKSNLPKVLSAIGTISDRVKFDGTSQNAKTQAVKNFEQFDVIFNRMEKNTLLGALNEVQAVSVLQMYLTQRIVDEISSYTNVDWKFLSYTEIVKTIQFLYIPLNLVIFQNIVLSYRIDKGESFLEFSSRVFRHLKLCSRLKSPEERDSYVELHRCAILKNSLPPDTLNTINKKEQIYRAFSSQEILDHVISGYHLAGSGDETAQYHVFYTQKNNEDLSPAASQIRTLEKKNEQRKKTSDNPPVSKEDKRKNMSYRGRGNQNMSYRSRGNQNRHRYLGNRGENHNNSNNQTLSPPNIRGPRLQLQDVPQGTCVKCLSARHNTQACPVYSHAPICRAVCLVNNQPHGFHYHTDCTVRQNSDRTNKDRKSNYNSYQNKGRQSRVFRPFRIQK